MDAVATDQEADNESDDGTPLPYVAAVVIAVLAVGGLVIWRRKRAERSDQAAADTAG